MADSSTKNKHSIVNYMERVRGSRTAVNIPTSTLERIAAAVQGEVYVEKNTNNDRTRHGSKPKLEQWSVPHGRFPTNLHHSIKLSDYVEAKQDDGETPKYSRAFSEVYFAAAVAEGIHTLSGIQHYSPKGLTKFKEARSNINKVISELRTKGEKLTNHPKLIEAKEKVVEAYKLRFDVNEIGEKELEDTKAVQMELLNHFKNNAAAAGLIDNKSLLRVLPVIQEFISEKNKGKDFSELANSVRCYQHLDTMYNQMLLETYGADYSHTSNLAQRMFTHHQAEIQAWLSGLKYVSSSGKREDCDIDISSYSSPYIQNEVSGSSSNASSSKITPIAQSFQSRFNDKKSQWSVNASIKSFKSSRDPNQIHETASLLVAASLVGRVTGQSINFTPDYKSWVNSQSYKPSDKDKSLDFDYAQEAYQKNLAKIEQLNKENEAKIREREAQVRAEIEAKNAEKRIEVSQKIDKHYNDPILTRDNIRGTYVEAKKLHKLLDYPELHGMLHVGELYGIPAVTLTMGTDLYSDSPQETGLQYLAHQGYRWELNDGDTITNKMFDVVAGEMKHNFVQFGEIGDNTTIITAEGFATAGSLYIAAREKGLDVAVVAAMFVDNLSHCIEHYIERYPNNPIINAADNDCFVKVEGLDGSHELRALELNAGAREALNLLDQYGVKSFGLDWESLDILEEASKIKATDYNDLFELYTEEKALELMGDQLESVIKAFNVPAKDLVSPRTYVDAESGAFSSVFEAYGYDPHLVTSQFVVGENFTPKAGMEVKVEKSEESLNNAPDQDSHTEHTTPQFALQRYNDGNWQNVDSYASVAEVANAINIERQNAFEGIYEELRKSEKNENEAFEKAHNGANTLFRCLDESTGHIFTTVENYDAQFDKNINDIVLVVGSEDSIFTRPIRVNEDNELVIGGNKTLPQPRFNSKHDIAAAIESILQGIYFSDTTSYEWVTEESFILRTVDENGKPDRSTSRTFNDEFGISVNEVQKSLTRPVVTPTTIDEQSNETVTLTTTDLEGNPQNHEISLDLLPHAVEDLESVPNIINVDTNDIDQSLLAYNIEAAETEPKEFTVVSYAPNGVINGRNGFSTIEEAKYKVNSFVGLNIEIPTTIFDKNQTPIETTLGPIKVPLASPQVPEQSLKEQELSKSEVNKTIQGFESGTAMVFPPALPKSGVQLKNGNYLHPITKEPLQTISEFEFAQYLEDKFSVQREELDNNTTTDRSNVSNESLESLVNDGVFSGQFNEFSTTEFDEFDFNEEGHTVENESESTVEPSLQYSTLSDLDITTEDSPQNTVVDLFAEAASYQNEQSTKGVIESDNWNDLDDFEEIEHPEFNYDSADLDNIAELESDFYAEQFDLGPTYSEETEHTHEVNIDLLQNSLISQEVQDLTTPLPVQEDIVDLVGQVDSDPSLDSTDDNNSIERFSNEVTMFDAEHSLESADSKQVHLSDTSEHVQLNHSENPNGTSQGNDDTTNNAVQENQPSELIDISNLDIETDIKNDSEPFSAANLLSAMNKQRVWIQGDFQTQQAPYINDIGLEGQYCYSETDLTKSYSILTATPNSYSQRFNDVPSVSTNASEIQITEVNKPTNEKLKQIFQRSKNNAWAPIRSNSSSRDILDSIVRHENDLAVNESQNSTVNLASLASEEPTTSAERAVPPSVSEEQQRQHNQRVEVDSDISLEESISTVLANLENPKNQGILIDILQRFAKIETTKDLQTDLDVSSDNSQRNIADISPTSSTNYQIDFSTSFDVTEHVEKANAILGNKGPSAVIKHASFLHAAHTNPNASIEELTQRALEVVMAIKDPEDELQKQECLAKAKEVAEWLNEDTRMGMLIESTRSPNDGKLQVFSAFDASVKDYVYGCMGTSYKGNERLDLKNSGKYVLESRLNLKDAIEKRQIPSQTIRQVLYGIYNRKSTAQRPELQRLYGSVKLSFDKSVSKFFKRLEKEGHVQIDPSSIQNYLYVNPNDGSESVISKKQLTNEIISEVIEREIVAVNGLPRNATNSKREPYDNMAAHVFERITSIDTGLTTPYNENQPWNTGSGARRGDGSRSDIAKHISKQNMEPTV